MRGGRWDYVYQGSLRADCFLAGVCAGTWELEMTPAVVDESWTPGAAVRGMPSVSSTVVVVASSLVNRLRRIGGRRQQERVFEKI